MSSTTLELLTLDPGDGAGAIQLLPRGNPRIAKVGKFDPGWPVSRTNIRDRAGASGQIDATSLHGGRIVTLELDILDGPSARRLVASCAPARRPVLTFRRAIDDIDWRMLLAGDSADVPDTLRSLDLQATTLQWRCPDGLIEGAVLQSRSMSAASSGGGVTVPFTVPVTLPATAARGIATVDQVGEEPAWPVLRIDGPCTNPAVHNDTTGEVISLTYDLAVNNFIVIDHRDATVRLNGDADASLFDKLELPASSFWQLQSGPQQVRFTATASAAPAKATIQWRPALLW